ncbi:MAG: GAF domain-containing protein, partial [Candidatus Margulisiibacteriota bacterium]
MNINMHLNFFLYTPILIFGTVLTLFVLFKDLHNKVNQSFSILGGAIVFWIFCLLFADTTASTRAAMFWCQMAIIGPSFIPAAFLNFALWLTNKPLKLNHLVLFMPAFFISSLSFTGLNVTKVTIQSWGADMTAGPLYPVLFAYFISYLAFATYFMIKSYQESRSLLQKQLGYVFFGYAFAIVVGLLTNLLLILSGVSQFSVLGPFSCLIFISAVAYAILKHHLMDIDIIIKRSFVYSLLIAVITALYSINAFVLGLILGGPNGTVAAVLVQAVLVAVGFKPLESYLSHLTDRFFFAKKYDYRKTVQEITKNMASVMKLEELLEIIGNTIVKEMKVSNISIFLKGGNTLQLKYYQNHDLKKKIDVKQIPEKHPLLSYFNSNARIINKDLLLLDFARLQLSVAKRKEEMLVTEALQKLHSVMLIPYFVKGELIGFMSIGEKLSGDDFSTDDISLLETLADQAAISIENARLYSSSLHKVTELLALYEVGKVVSSGQKLEEALQTILDTVVNVINVDRGIIFLYDKDRQALVARAACGRKQDWQKIKLDDICLPIKKSVFGKLLRTKQSVLKSNIKTSAAALGQTFLKLLEVEAYAAVPLICKDNVIGVLAVDNKISKTPIEKINMGLLNTLATQAAVAIENARLYQETQDNLQELQDLNKELVEMKNYNEDVLLNMSSGLIVMDNKGILQTINPQAEKIIGRSKEDLIGKKPA